jgi:hypothetical protein
MRVHTYSPIGVSPKEVPQITKRIKYKIYDFGDMCIIAYSSSQVECYRFVDRFANDSEFVEVLEKMPVGYTPPHSAICSVIDVGLTKDPNTFIYGNYVLKVSEQAQQQSREPTNVFEQMSSPRVPKNPKHTNQFKRKPLAAQPLMRAATSIPLVMPQPIQNEEQPQKKIRPRLPMMSIPLMMPAAME